jgi:hypothetical protein
VCDDCAARRIDKTPEDRELGLYVRKSVNFGPLRVNLSKSGVGYSIGGRGFRTGVRADGRRYTRVSAPGTGVGYYATHGGTTRRRGTSDRSPGGGGCLLYVALLSGAAALVRLA